MANKSIGISNKENLAGWADYAKRNSYQCDKAQLKRNLSGEGAAADLRINEAEAPLLNPMRVAAGRRRKPIPTPAEAAASGTKQRTLRVLIRSYRYPNSRTAPSEGFAGPVLPKRLTQTLLLERC
jgi:hypothetical protein